MACFSGIPAICLLMHELTSKTPRSLFFFWRRGVLFSLGYYLGVYHWFLYMYPLSFIEGLSDFQALGVVLFAWIGLSLVATLCFSFIHLNVALFSRTHIVKRFPILLAPLFAAVFAIFSYLISLTWAGVPWGMFSLTQTAFPTVIATASLFGNYFVTFVIVLVNALFAYGVLLFIRSGFLLRRAAFPCLLAISVYLVNLICGTVIYHTPHKASGHFTAAVLQGNVSSREKWGEAGGETLYDRYETLLDELMADARVKKTPPALIVWSETAIPTGLDRMPHALSTSVSTWLKDLAEKTNAAHLVGAFTYQKNENSSSTEKEINVYNSIYLIKSDKTVDKTVYHKQRLVPFGEFVPWEKVVTALFPSMAKLSLMSDLQAGTESAVFFSDVAAIGSLICFDSIYDPLARNAVRDGAECLAISTNDSWFENSPALYQHNAQAILRAVENGRYVMRSANTGISSVITNRGEVVSALDDRTTGYLLENITTYSYRTLYTYIGNLFVYLCMAAVLLLPAGDVYIKIKKARKK